MEFVGELKGLLPTFTGAAGFDSSDQGLGSLFFMGEEDDGREKGSHSDGNQKRKEKKPEKKLSLGVRPLTSCLITHTQD
jgi:hypothetical protein